MIEFQDLGFDLVSKIPFSLNMGFAVVSIIPFCLGLLYVLRDGRPKTEHVYTRNDEFEKRKQAEVEELERLDKNREIKLAKLKKPNTLTPGGIQKDTKYCRDCLIPLEDDDSEGDFCNSCIKDHSHIEKNFDRLPSKIPTNLEVNENFATKTFDFNDGLESVIELNYKAPKATKVKLFFSTDDFKTFSRNYTELKDDNFIRFVIRVAGKAYSSLISGGNYDFNDSFDTGYTMFVSMKYNDPQLMSIISNVLRKHNFGCLPAKHTIHAHKNEKHPMDHLAAELLSEITKDVSMVLKA